MGENQEKPVIGKGMEGVAESPEIHEAGRPDLPAAERPGRRFVEAVREFKAGGGFDAPAREDAVPVHKAGGLDVRLPKDRGQGQDRDLGKDRD